MKYILIWKINDYPEMGGGTEFKVFEDIKTLEEEVNKLASNERISFDLCAELLEEKKIEAVEIVKTWKINDL